MFQGTLGEENKSLALHNALVLAKVVRRDYPEQWPEALPTILDTLRATKSGNQEQLNGALAILIRVVKELGTARLRSSQTALQAITPELFFVLGEIYAEKTQIWVSWLTTGRGDEDDADLAMENSLVAVKILRRLMIMGFEVPHQDKYAQEFWSVSQSHLGEFLGFISHDSAVPAPYQDTVGKHLLQFTKLHLEMSDVQPASFALLPNSIPLVHAYWDLVAKFAEVFDKSGGLRQSTTANGSESKSKVEGPLLEKLALKGLLLIRNCISMIFRPQQTFKYRSQEVKKQQQEAISIIKAQLLKNDFVLQIVNVIITKLLIFRKADLDAWEQDPEEFESQERHLGDAWEWEVRPCAERLYLDLLTHYKELLSPPLLSYFQSAASANSDVITKEAIYTAMGSAAANLFEVFDFDGFLKSTIVQDAQSQGPLAKVLRRRIAILLSQWVPVKIEDSNRALVFDVYRHLMNHNDEANDEVVRLTAARQLKYIADDFSFPGDIFANYAADIFQEFAHLLGETAVTETRLAILETLRVLVARMEEHVIPFADKVVASVSSLWDEYDDEYMIKQSILAFLSCLVLSMRGAAQPYQQFMLPLILKAQDPRSGIHLFLIDEAVDLWKAILSQSSSPLTQELIGMIPQALPLMEYVSNLADDGLEIIKSYITLAPEAVLLDNVRQETLKALATSTMSKQREQVFHSVKCLEFLLRAAADLAGSNGITIIVEDLSQIGFLQHILTSLQTAWESHQTTGPNRKKSPISSILEADYFAILARVAVADPTIFVKVMEAAGELGGVWKWLGEEWFSSFDAMADFERQKLSCMALTRLLELPQPIEGLVLERLQDYFAMWTSVVENIRDANGDDTQIWREMPPSQWDMPMEIVEKQWTMKDPVHQVHTYTYVMERLQNLIQRTGGEAQFEANWAVNIDKEILVGFRNLSNPPPRAD